MFASVSRIQHHTIRVCLLFELHHTNGSVCTCLSCVSYATVPAGSPSRGGDVAVYINQPSLPTPFHSVLVSVSVFMALSTVFLFINSPENSPLSHYVLPVFFIF